jgi:hypothetical protein
MDLKKALTRTLSVALLIFANYVLITAQADSIYRLPTGTRISVRLDAEISSGVSSLNDTFVATVSRPVTIRDAVVLPAGTQIEGRVTLVRPASAGGRSGELDVAFETLKLGADKDRTIDGRLVIAPKAKPDGPFRMLIILGGTAAGAILGSIARPGIGTAIGAGIGAGAGTGVALARKGRDVRLKKQTDFEIELRKEVVLPVIDY